MTKTAGELEGHRWVGGSLVRKRCVPCEGELEPLPAEQARRLVGRLPHWSLSEDERAIERVLEFQSFQEALSFIGALGWLVEREGHHPDVHLYYRQVRVAFRTHAVDALTENDFIGATLVDDLAGA
ncbi:MAG: hypothetical protein AMXMBFR64_01680 [Myxococcales bacterium]